MLLLPGYHNFSGPDETLFASRPASAGRGLLACRERVSTSDCASRTQPGKGRPPLVVALIALAMPSRVHSFEDLWSLFIVFILRGGLFRQCERSIPRTVHPVEDTDLTATCCQGLDRTCEHLVRLRVLTHIGTCFLSCLDESSFAIPILPPPFCHRTTALSRISGADFCKH